MKLVLDDIRSGVDSSTHINDNSRDIEAAITNAVLRSGTSPNAMQVPLDMNSFRIKNLVSSGLNDMASMQDVLDLIASGGELPTVGDITFLAGSTLGSLQGLYTPPTGFGGGYGTILSGSIASHFPAGLLGYAIRDFDFGIGDFSVELYYAEDEPTPNLTHTAFTSIRIEELDVTMLAAGMSFSNSFDGDHQIYRWQVVGSSGIVPGNTYNVTIV